MSFRDGTTMAMVVLVVLAGAGGYSSGTGGPAEILTGQTTAPQPEILGELSGRVFDAQTGDGIPGAIVVARPRRIAVQVINGHTQTSALNVETATDDTGTYRAVGLRQGDYQMTVRAPAGYVDLLKRQEKRVTVHLGQDGPGPDFALTTGTVVRGKVLDIKCNPVPGVPIGVRESTVTANVDDVDTDGQGAFELTLVPGSHVALRATRPGYATILTSLDVPTEEAAPLALCLEPEGVIEGTVVNESGRVASEFLVMARLQGETTIRASDRIPFDGSFDLRALTSGVYEVAGQIADRPQLTEELWHVTTVRVEQGAHVRDARVVVRPRPGLAIRGRVVDASGEPIPGARISAGPTANLDLPALKPGELGRSVFPEQTGEDGAFWLEGLAERLYRLTVDAHGYPTAFPLIQAGTDDVTIDLEGAGAIQGHLVAARTGTPLSHFEIRLAYRNVSGRGDETEYVPVAFDNPKGRFSLASRRSGNARLTFRAEGYAPATVVLPGLSKGQAVAGLRVELHDPARITGTVADTAGRPVEGAFVWTRDDYFPEEDGGDGAWLPADSIQRTDRDGRFTLSGQSHGDRCVQAWKEGFAPTRAIVALTEGEEEEVQLELTESAGIEGYVTIDGRPVADIRVTAAAVVDRSTQGLPRLDSDGLPLAPTSVNTMGGMVPSPYDRASATTDKQGHYRIARIRAGATEIHCTLPSGTGRRDKRVQVTLDPGVMASINIEALREGGASLEGYTTDASGGPLPGVQVCLAADTDGSDKEQWVTRSSETGYYSLDGIVPGEIGASATYSEVRTVQTETGYVKTVRESPPGLSLTLSLRAGEVRREDFSFPVERP